MKRGNWTDNPCWFASVQDAGKTALLLGPFRTEEDCRKFAYIKEEDGGSVKGSVLHRWANKLDPKSVFYSYGMVKMENGHRSGILNVWLKNDLSGWQGMDFEPIQC